MKRLPDPIFEIRWAQHNDPMTLRAHLININSQVHDAKVGVGYAVEALWELQRITELGPYKHRATNFRTACSVRATLSGTALHAELCAEMSLSVILENPTHEHYDEAVQTLSEFQDDVVYRSRNESRDREEALERLLISYQLGLDKR